MRKAFSRWLKGQPFHRLASVFAVIAVASGLITAVSMPSSPGRPPVPVQQTGTAAGRPDRAPTAATLGHVVDGHVVHGPAGLHVTPAVENERKSKNWAAEVSGAVPAAPARKPLHLPVQGKPHETVEAEAAPKPKHVSGYDPKTSRQLPLKQANQVTYSNADGTSTTFDYATPVNYRRANGTWASISTTLVPDGPASAGGAAAAYVAAPDLTGSPASSTSSIPQPTSSATPSTPVPSPSLPTAPPQAGWTERSEALPQSFAPYASEASLVTMPLGSGESVGFGVSGASPVPGSASGSTVSYAGVLADSTLELTAGTGLVKEQIVLSSPDAPTSWLFPLNLTGLKAMRGPGGLIDFTNPAGKVVAYIPHGFMTDSDVNPHSGEGATSYGVTYALVTDGGQPAIRMTLDAAWLHSSARVFPVTVDPSVDAINSNGTTFVQSPFNADNSGSTEMSAGTYDGGSNVAESYISFGSVASTLKNDTVLGATLDLFNTWSYSCSARPVYIYPVTSSWSVTGDKTYPGPSTGASIGSKSFATGWVPYGSTTSPCPSKWEPIGLNQAGTNLINGWTHGTVADDGLAVAASSSDSYGWKQFASYQSGNGNPFLAITYTTDGASYKMASRTPITPVEPGQNGKFAINVTNTGSTTWTSSNGYELSYRAYNSVGQLVANHPVFTAMPSSVAPGQTVTVDATMDQLSAGYYAIDWDMYSGAPGSPVSFSSEGIAPYAMGLYVPEPPPVITGIYPPTGDIASTLQQELSVTASTASGTVTYSFTMTCEPPTTTVTCSKAAPSSGSISTPYWTPPAASLQWDMPYDWSVTTTVKPASGNSSSTTVSGIAIEFEPPQPAITAGLGQSSGQAYDPLSGNYTTAATDAAVEGAGIPLEIDRTYNSMDPRTTGAFGAGWSSVVDTALRADGDGSGSVLITMPNGEQIRFGENDTGTTYSPPFGSSDVLVHNSSGTWTLRDSSDTQYTFSSAGVITSITNPNGQSEDFTPNSSGQIATITNEVSGRSLTLTWSGTTSGSHVTSVTTPVPASGQSAETWTYSYSGSDLSQVCGPSETCSNCTATAGCTNYSYSSASDYFPSVLDADPRGYWQFGDASGSTGATDEVSTNLTTTSGTYTNVTLGVAGPLAGNSETAASFNGTSSHVTLPTGLMSENTDAAVGLWFKASSSTASGVLFEYSAQPTTTASGNHEPLLYIGTNGHLYGEFWMGKVEPLESAASVDDGNWHYVLISASTTSQSMYLDGKQVGSALAGQIIPQGMTYDSVGAGYWTSWTEASSSSIGYFSGDIGQVAVYSHPVGLNVVTAQETLGTTTGAGQLTKVLLPSGNQSAAASYDSSTDRVTSYTDQNGGTWSISAPEVSGYKASSDGLGEVTEQVEVTDPPTSTFATGRQETYSYDMLDGGRLISYSNGADPPVSYGYDADGYLASATDADGNLVCFTNDAFGNVVTRTWYPLEPASLPGGGIGTDPACGGSTASSPTCTSTGAPCTTFYGYDTTDDTTQPLNPDNNELIWESDGRSASDTDTTYRTTYGYNTVGQLTSSTTPPTSDFPSGRTTSYTYTAAGQTAYGGSGDEPTGLLATETTPGAAKTTYQYYSNGDLGLVTEPSQRSTAYTYDGLGRALTDTVTTSTYPSGETTSYTYTPSSQVQTVTDPSIGNPVTDTIHTLQDAYAYDADGNLTTLTQSDTTGGDPSRTTSYVYNDHDQVATMTEPAGATSGGTSQSQGASSANPAGATTAYTYDAYGNLASETDPNQNVYKYAYNEYQEQTQQQLYTSSTSESSESATCTAPWTQDPDGGCDLTLQADTYDPAGLLSATTDAMGRITNYTYDDDQELLQQQSVDPTTSPTTGRQTTWSYDGGGNLIATATSALTAGAVGTTTTTDYTIDAADRLTSEVADAGTASGDLKRTVAYTYNADNDVLSQSVGTAAQGGPSVTNYTYDSAGDTLSQTVVDGSTNQTTTWTYDQNGLPLTMTTPDGNVSGGTPANYTTSYGYDPAGDLSTVTGAPVATQTYSSQTPATTRPVTTYGYDSYGDQTQAVDPDQNETVAAYDGDGRITSLSQPSYTPPQASSPINGTTSYGYDEDGNLTSVTDAEGNVTSYSYDALGDVLSVTEPQMQGQSSPGVWNYTYDADAEQLSAEDPYGNTARATYDYFGDTATTTDPMSNTTSYAYDYLGDQTKVTTPDNSVTTNTYDHLGELTSTADAYDDTSSFSYNYAGLPTVSTNPDGSYTQDSYDEAGQLTSIADYSAAGSQLRSESLGYDASGNQTSVKDWNGNTTSYGYNAADQLTSQVVPVSASSSITTSYGYDKAGNQTAVTDGNNNTEWTTYNAWSLPESVIEPTTPAEPTTADTTWTTGYNSDGQQASVSQPGGITQSYGYDSLGDLTSESGTGGTAPTVAQSLTYDLDGRLTSATAPAGTDSLSYNADSELTGASGPSGTSGYTYNGDGLVKSETSPAGTTSYTYDSADRLSTEADPLTGSTLTWGYNSDSQPTSIGYSTGGASGPTQSFGYDSLDRLQSDTLTSASGTTLASEAYGYDADDNLTSQTTTGLSGSGTASYAYDEADRLTSQTSGGTTTPFGYDGDGNLTKDGGTSYSYNAQDQLTSTTGSAGTTSYSYTPSGALASVTPPSGSPQDYTSDAFGNLITAPGGISYAYDALGRPVTRTSGSTTSSLSYLGTSDSVASDGADTYTYTPAGAVTSAQASGGTAYNAMSDVHGDLTGWFSPSSSTSSLAGSAAYSPYGTVTASSGFQPSIGYQGEWTDPSTGQVDMGARWYDPSTGSFATNDTVAGSPLSSSIDGNPYAYTSGDPLTETDPTGHLVSPEQIARAVTRGAGEDDPEIALPFYAGVGAGYAIGSPIACAMQVGACGGMESFVADEADQGLSDLQQLGQALISPFDEFVQELLLELAEGELGQGGGPALAHLPTSTGKGSASTTSSGLGPCAIECGPPPPPPPPQNCYAAGLCSPPKAPQALRDQVRVTDHVKDDTNFNQACNVHCVREKTPQPVKHKIAGTGGCTNSTCGNLNDTVSVDTSDFLQTVNLIGTPGTPTIYQPVKVKAINGGKAGNAPKPQPAAAGAGARGGNNGGKACVGLTVDLPTGKLTTAEELASLIEYARRANAWLKTNGGATVQSTKGQLGKDKDAAARRERLRADQNGTPYQGQAGHVPDTALSGMANPPAGWLDMAGKSNNVAGAVLGSRIGKVICGFTINGRAP